jgi:hypothetical protein
MKSNFIKILILSITTLFFSCTIEPYEGTIPNQDNPNPINPTVLPVLTTTSITNIGTVSASSGGTITSDGGSPVIARGVVWSTNQNPTIANSKTVDGSNIGSFSSSITNLIAGTIYYVRAYATTANGTSYGNQVSFTTTSVVNNPSALMNATVNGVQYTHMGPFTYPLFVNKQTSVDVYSITGNEERYLHLQGGNDSNFTIEVGDLEINLNIPESQWRVGTFDLITDAEDSRDGTNSWVNFIYFQNNVDFTSEIAGTITITEFNRTTKKIKGTFSFQYENEMSGSGAIQGPYNVSNGTFDYNLDDPYFN